jgi:hypothetical protein
MRAALESLSAVAEMYAKELHAGTTELRTELVAGYLAGVEDLREALECSDFTAVGRFTAWYLVCITVNAKVARNAERTA